jgi:hypothetical protein
VETEAELSINIKLDTLEAYKVTETRLMPSAFMQATRIKYAEIEDLQWRMPELADCRFNLDDIFPRFALHYEINVRSYFLTDKEPTPAEYTSLSREIDQRLELYKALHHRRAEIRQVFVSYNLVKMTEARDALSMSLASFTRLLNDCMVMGEGVTNYTITKVFAISSLSSKSMPELSSNSEREWLDSFLKININNIYRLSLSGFIEALIRLVSWHPRFAKLGMLSLTEKFLLFYERSLKPNALINNVFFFEPVLDDVHMIDLANHFEGKLSELYAAYLIRLSERSQLLSMIEGAMKLELTSFYGLLDDLSVLEKIKYEDDEDEHAPDRHSSVRNTITSTKFASSLISKSQGRATLRQKTETSEDFLPISVPQREEMQINKYTAFCLFLSAMRVSTTQRNYEIFFLDRSFLSEADFSLSFLEFSDLMLVLAMYYWKTAERSRSLVTAAYDYLNCTIAACLKARSATFIQRTDGLAVEKLMKERAKKGQVVLSRAALPQPTVHRRRFSA